MMKTTNSKSLMNIARSKAENGKSIWRVEFEPKLIAKIANGKFNKDKLTFNSQEEFEVSIKVKDGSTGFIRNINNGKTIDYKVTYIDMANASRDRDPSKVKVRFDFADGRRFEYVFSKDFRSFNTGAFYRFFNDVLRKTQVLSSVKFN